MQNSDSPLPLQPYQREDLSNYTDPNNCEKMNNSVDGNSTLLSTKTLLYVQYLLYTAGDSINLILSLPTNAYVLWLIVSGAGGMMASDFFSLNLAVTDILTCLSSLMFILHNHILHYLQEDGVLWSVAIFFKGFILTGRPLFQCCICVERYLAVVYPVTFLKYKPLRYRVGCCAVVWLMVLGSCFAYMLGESKCIMNDFTLGFTLVMCSVMLFCCLAVLRALKCPGPGEEEGMNNMKLRAFKIISMILVSMVVTYLPLVLQLIIYRFIKQVEYTFGMSICFTILVVSGFVQPLLYIHRAEKLPCIRSP
ncbi:P2Y purinoceptor 8 [Salmo trutta]|uniref:P2Y purinoceptor 8 n=1 Tax=Salmo trutta TaxID=8032 RepID=UPI00113034EB|nr:P2Y purinoceptor 8-like [Salmo trutta]